MNKIEYCIIAVKNNDIQMLTLLYDNYGINCLIDDNNQNIMHHACASLSIEQNTLTIIHDILGEDIFLDFLRMKDKRHKIPFEYASKINNTVAIQYIYNTIDHDDFNRIVYGNDDKSQKIKKLARDFFVMPEILKQYLLNDDIELSLDDLIEMLSTIDSMEYNSHETLIDFDSFMNIKQVYPVYKINKNHSFSRDKCKDFVEYFKKTRE
jgi:hypothetical protein